MPTNDAADRLCRDRAGEAVPKGHQDFVSRLDGIHQEVCDILGRRAWILLTSEDRPPLDAVTPFCKPGRQPARTSPATVLPRPPPVAKDGGPNKAYPTRPNKGQGKQPARGCKGPAGGPSRKPECSPHA